MVKAIFFDWFDTLARYEPPREELYRRALNELGIDVIPETLKPAVFAADRYFFGENARSPVERRNPQEKGQVYLRYQSIVLSEAGISADRELMLKLIERMQQLSRGVTFILFDDVLPTLKALKEQEFTLGLLTNASIDMIAVNCELGLQPYLDFVVTSQEAGAEKPKPPIFLAALERAGVHASKAIHVGDQYKLDVEGARGVGIKPVLIDRYDANTDISDCPRITNLYELIKRLRTDLSL